MEKVTNKVVPQLNGPNQNTLETLKLTNDYQSRA